MSHTPANGAAAGSRRFWAVVFTFAILNAATWVGYHEYTTSRLRLLRVTRFEPGGDSPINHRQTLRWEFNLDVARPDRAPGTIAPNVPGKWFWPDGRTLTFTPDADWPRATKFSVTLAGDRVRTPQGIRLDRAFAESFFTEPLHLTGARQDSFDERNQLVLALEFNDTVLPSDVISHLKLTDARKHPIDFHALGQAPGKIVRVQTNPVDQLAIAATGSVVHLELTEGLAGSSGPLGMPGKVERDIAVASELQAIEASAPEPGAGDAQVSLQFNNAVDAQVVRQVVSVEPAVDFKVTNGGENVALSGAFEPGKRYLIKIAAAPAGADRKKFPRADSFSVFIPDRRQEVWFEHAEGYLGANGNRTLLAHAVNVSQITATVTRLYDNNVVAWRNSNGGGQWNDTHELAKPVAEHKFTLPAMKNQVQDVRLSLDDLLPPDAARDGVYRIALSTTDVINHYRRRYEDEEGYEAASTIVALSDVALHARQSRDALDVWAVSLSSAQPLRDVLVRAYSNKNQLLGEGHTDANGLLRLPALHPAKGEHVAVLTAQRESPTRLAGEAEKASHFDAGHGLTWLDLEAGAVNLAQFDTGGKPFLRSGFEAFIFTERGVYRPGETAHLRAIVRGSDLTIPGTFPVKWQLRRPDLRDWQSQVVALAADGTSCFDVTLPTDIPTGRWTAELELPGETGRTTLFGSATFNVEEFMPARMKVKLDVANNAERVSIANAPLTAEIRADYLFGQPVSDRPATLTTRIEAATFSPKEWSDWTFGDLANTGEVFNGKRAIGGRAEQATMTLDANGRAKWELEADELLNPSEDSPTPTRSRHRRGTAPLSKATDYPGPWRASFYAAVIETGGRAVSVSRSVEVDRLSHYLGIKPRSNAVSPGSPAEFELVAVAPNGKIHTDGSKVEVRLYRETWNTTLVEERGSYRYVSTRQLEPIGEAQSVTMNGGRGTCRITPTTDGSFVLTAKDANGFLSSLSFYASAGAWEENVNRDDPEKIEVVLSKTPKPIWQETFEAFSHPSAQRLFNFWHHNTIRLSQAVAFRAGETAQVLVRSPFAGKLLLCVESDSILSKRVIDMPASHLSAAVELPRGCGGGAFVTATVIRPINPNAPWRTHRAFGVARVPIDNSALKLDVEITAPGDMRPGQSLPIVIHVVDADGRPAAGAAVTVAAVDEGILSLTNYVTPNPFVFFTTKRAHGVKWSDIYNHLMPEVARAGRSSETGGDKDGDAPASRHTTPVTARRVRPVAFVTAVLHADSAGVARADFPLPDFAGQLRVMAIASDLSGFGSSQATTLVRSPLTIQSSWPRFAAPGDTFTVPVTLFNRTSKAAKAKVSADFVVDGSPSPLRFIAGNGKHIEIASDTIPPGGSATVEFPVHAEQIAGVAHAHLSATLDGETSQETIELPVRPASPEVSVGGFVVATPGHPATMPIGNDFMPGTARVQIQAGPMPSLELPRGLDYLEHYPYGCAEQTTSECFPLLALSDVGAKIAPGLFEARRVDERLQSGITTLIGTQCADGGLAMWPGQRQAWPWASIYAAHMLVEAERAGHKVPLDFRDSLLAYVRNLLNQATDKSEIVEVQAYACYVLALAGRPQHAVMDRLTEIVNHPRSSHGDEGEIGSQASFHLAAAWLASGRRDLAEALIPKVLPQPRSKRQLGGNVGSPVRDRAILLSTLLDVQPDRPELPEIAQRLADAGRQGHWQSTQDAAFAVMALGKYLRQSKPGSPFESATVSIAGKILGRAAKGESIALKPSDFGDLSFEIAGPADAKGYLAWLSSGVPMKAPADEDAGMHIRRRYLTAAGNPIANETVHSGDLVCVEITVDGEPMQNVVIDDLLPAGLEIENDHLATSADQEQTEENKSKANSFSHGRADARDDRLVVVGDLTGAGKETFKYLARAVTPGTFVIPPVRGECMYDVGVHSLSGGGHMLTVLPFSTGKNLASAER